MYEKGSGAKLNMAKCEDLWLGSWSGRADSPVDISWSSVKVKVLGVFLGPGNLEVENWRPRITAVENALNSWRQRSLASPLCPTLLLRHALFGFSSDELLVVPKVFCYLLNVSKFYIWVARNDFRFRGKRPSAVNVMERVKSRVRFFLFLCSSVASVLLVVVVFLFANGVLVVLWLPFGMMFSWSTFSLSLSCVFVFMSWPFLGRTTAFAMDESVDWRSSDLPFALALGHACPVV